MKQTPWQSEPAFWAKLHPIAQEMRQQPTPAEDALWQQLRNRQVAGLKFRRQHAIHQYSAEHDEIRQEYLEALGLKVLRFTNQTVLADPPRVAQDIVMQCASA